MKTSTLVAGAVSLVVLSLMACKKDDPPPATPIQPTTSGTTTPQPGQPGYQQPGYQPATATSAVPGQLATPGPTALACSNDGQCMFHHCNMQYQKCAFPCVSDTDCIQGAHCMTALGALAVCLAQ